MNSWNHAGADPQEISALGFMALHKARTPMGYAKRKEQPFDLTPGVQPVALDELTRLFAAISRRRLSGNAKTKRRSCSRQAYPRWQRNWSRRPPKLPSRPCAAIGDVSRARAPIS
jgi:hypothetical protein